MNPIEHAECRRVLERGNQLCADVEVRVKGRDNHLVALFAESHDNDYDMGKKIQTAISIGTTTTCMPLMSMSRRSCSPTKRERRIGTREKRLKSRC